MIEALLCRADQSRDGVTDSLRVGERLLTQTAGEFGRSQAIWIHRIVAQIHVGNNRVVEIVAGVNPPVVATELDVVSTADPAETIRGFPNRRVTSLRQVG